MSYRGQFIARIPNDENANAIIDQYKSVYGQLLLRGRHPKRKQVMAQNGLIPNFMGDIPYRLSQTIVIYLGESGMPYNQFRSLKIGDMIEQIGIWKNGKQIEIHTGIVLDKKGKNKVKVAVGKEVYWTTRQSITRYKKDKS